MNRLNLLGQDCQELLAIVQEMGEKSFRGKQLYHHLYRRREHSFSQMSELPSAFRSQLEEKFRVDLPQLHRRTESQDGTVKLLFRLHDDQFVETVVIPEEDRTTLCISSQVGCDVGCTFCMTAQMGFTRNLNSGEILGQILAAIDSDYVPPRGFNIVFMGMGEPLYNYKHLMKAFRIMVDPQGMGLSKRRITVSTAGVIPVLERMHSEPILPNLAVSLNATTDELRNELMPLNQRWPIQDLLDCCRRFPLEPRRRITFEYILLKGVTDSPKDAHRLAGLLRGIPSKVNLIPYNPNPGLPYQPPPAQAVDRFRQILSNHHISAFVRKTRGGDISAACGQLTYLETQGEHA